MFTQDGQHAFERPRGPPKQLVTDTEGGQEYAAQDRKRDVKGKREELGGRRIIKKKKKKTKTQTSHSH